MAAEPVDSLMSRAGLVDVGAMNDRLVIDLMYAGPDNFVGENMYGDLRKAYLHPEAAEALMKADAWLEEHHPELRFKICDAARPMSVQRKMYEKVKGTPSAPYVSNPARGGGLHNYGLAVDITLVDEQGRELPMGTPVDHLGKEANIDKEEELAARGVITKKELNNRRMLRQAMRQGGFFPLKTEWWHFNLRSRAVAKSRYPLLNF